MTERSKLYLSQATIDWLREHRDEGQTEEQFDQWLNRYVEVIRPM